MEGTKKSITSYIPLQKEDLENALHHYVSLTKQYSELTKQRICTISSGCYERAYTLQRYLKENNGSIPQECIITEEDVTRFRYEVQNSLEKDK